MAKIKGKDTHPERIVRRLLHALGLRFRLHAPELPGRPDVCVRKSRKAVFVHGCFWHAHGGCPRFRIPKSSEAFWRAKLERNQARDARDRDALEAAGWSILVVWECEACSAVGRKGADGGAAALAARLADFFGAARSGLDSSALSAKASGPSRGPKKKSKRRTGKAKGPAAA